MRGAAFRLLRVQGASDGVVTMRDLASAETLHVLDGDFGPDPSGLVVAGRLARMEDGRHLFVTGVTPLDEAGLAVAQGFVRPGGRGLSNPLRCAEAVYRHVVRNGTLVVPGLNAPPGGWESVLDEDDEDDDLDRIARAWAAAGSVRDVGQGRGLDPAQDAADEQRVRTQAGIEDVLYVLGGVVAMRKRGDVALSNGYAAVLRVQLDTLRRREALGLTSVRLDEMAAAVEHAIAERGLPAAGRAAFAAARLAAGAAAGARDGGRGGGPGPRDAGQGGIPEAGTGSLRDTELERLIGRIQALRAKTVEQGCTEAEALAAAEKVGELLDRYGLSLGELELQQQACEGATVETGRKRRGPLDDCVPSIAHFCDCKTWSETARDGSLRYVFFGLPGDVAGARYLYDLVEMAFETEAAAFRAGPTYGGLPSNLRRTATTSFGVGMARGISAKLETLRTQREAATRSASGRDLVLAKAGVVDAEMGRLGLNFTMRKTGGRRVLPDAYKEGHAAGLAFEVTQGITGASASEG